MLPCPYISRRLGNSSSLYVSSRLRRGPGRPIAPLCNTQENLPPAQVQAWEKQTPSVTCLLYTRLLGLPSPLLLLLLLQSIRPLFSLLSLSAPRNLIISGPHSHDLSLCAPLKTNRSGLRRGAREAEKGQRMGMGMVVRREVDGKGGDPEKNPPMMKCSVTRRKSNSNITARSRCPAVPLSAFLFLLFLQCPSPCLS